MPTRDRSNEAIRCRNAPCQVGRSRAPRARVLAVLGTLLCVSQVGCLYTRYATDTKRSATEQLLVSESIDRVIGELAIPDEVSGRAVAVEIAAVETADTGYLKAALEQRLGAAGARVTAAAEAELVLTAIVGAIGTVSRKASFGLPSLPIPSIGATPELPFVSVVRQRGWTRLRVVLRSRDGGQLASSGQAMARARFDVISILFIELRRNDVYPGEDGSLAVE